MSVFNELDHRLSVVRRWGILHTIQSQSVAEHVFNVERIAVRIAREWLNITDAATLFRISQYALHHDDFEALSGDLPSMVKPYFDEASFEVEHCDLIPVPYNSDDWTRSIVKLADMLEGYHFLCIEYTMGNRYVERHWQNEPGRIRQFVEKTWPNDSHLVGNVTVAMQVMTNERSSRFSMRGR